MVTELKWGAIDADAHVVESDHTWDYMDPSDEKYRPKLFGPEDDSARRQWVIDGKMCGLRLATLSEQQLRTLSDRTGRDLMTAAGGPARWTTSVCGSRTWTARWASISRCCTTRCGSAVSPSAPRWTLR